MLSDRLRNFQELLHQEVPLTRHMDVRARDYDGQALTLVAELQPNINIHGTAFGGSLYSLAAVAAWGLLRLRLEDAGRLRDVILASADIKYRKPVRSRLVARAACDVGGFRKFVEKIVRAERAWIEVHVTLHCQSHGLDYAAASFRGLYSTFQDGS